ncbi:MAG: sigma 54-interacting transcriptional regulator [Clostridiales Family XIII bacterium]|jgi:PAS domain S-box-containing protein|nr:sigma 54-interacting transcriptional regulator [Clostridiales Family XIII bacterium]
MQKFINANYAILQEFINNIKVGIYIADGQGNVLMLNDESESTGGMTREEMLGKNVTELIAVGYMSESTIVNAMQSLREESIIQELGSGEKLYITGVPVFRNGKIEVVICTERDITEMMKLRVLLQEKERIEAKYVGELEYLRARQTDMENDIVAQSKEMRNVMDKAMRVASLDTTVLLYGESGTGKELIANLIHKNSSRSENAFIKINCTAIPENLLESELFGYEKGAFTGANKNGRTGMFELADKGTLFLDEIGEMSMQMQTKLLRVLQEREVIRIGGERTLNIDMRIIAATNVNLPAAIEAGRFREDLYYRLNVMPIGLPPLRQRKEDIAELSVRFVNHFNKEYNLNKVIGSAALQCLENYDWPGNARELRNIIERIMISFDGQEVTAFQVRNQLTPQENEWNRNIKIHEGTLPERISAFETDLLFEMIRMHENANRVAEALGVNKSTISRKLKKYGIR